MTRTNLAYFDGSYGYLTIVNDLGSPYDIVTTRAHADRYIHIDDGRQYPQLCAGGSRMGPTITWAEKPEDMAHHFARDCDARLYKTREGYEKARYRVRADARAKIE
jgi:hypothetical protein